MSDGEWYCIACRVKNRAEDVACENCGVTRPEPEGATASSATEKDPKAWDAARDVGQCSWRRLTGPRCPFKAGWYPTTRRYGFCSWHAEVDRDPQVNTFEEFARFCQKLKGPDELEVLDQIVEGPRRLLTPRYCTLWTHYPPGELWDFLESGGQGTLPAPRACYSPSCPYAPVEVTEDQVEKFRVAVRAGGWDHALATLKGTIRQ